jgi:recombination protein RecR
MYSPLIQKLIEKFSKFPTVGPRTAARFVFYLLKTSEKELEELISLVSQLKKSVKLCAFCFNPFEPSSAKALEDKGKLCSVCSNPGRDKSLLCLVEKEADLESLEKVKKYNGLYFILGGTIPALKQKELEKLRTKELQERIKNPGEFGLQGADFQEIILALNPTPEGEATALYLERILKKDLPAGRRVTRLGRGLPVGGELEYADEETLGSALEGRK